MNILKAIEILEEMHNLGLAPYDEDSSDALKLGIEALDLADQLQSLPGRRQSFRLPGQTKH